MPNCSGVFVMLMTLVSMILSTTAEQPQKLRRDSVLGMWSGTETNGLSCRVEFDATNGRVFTFRGNKHLTTVNFWWHIDRTGTNIVLGVNGNAHTLENGDLQLKLEPVNTKIVTARQVRLKRESPKP
jgi:hypothetical protein